MNHNPLFPSSSNGGNQPTQSGADQAADLIRKKLDQLYAEEPNAKQELQEAEIVRPRSKHQQYMHELSGSGRSLAEIQQAWHEYYQNLPDDEKHQVWQEFYANQNDGSQPKPQPAPAAVINTQPVQPQYHADPHVITGDFVPVTPTATDTRPATDIRSHIRDSVSKQAKRVNKSHFHSLLFGLSTGAIVLLVFLFSFFNEFVIAPFIQPGRTVSATPIIVDPASSAASGEPKIIIPKINVEIPIEFDQESTTEADIQNSLDDGVVHYPTTVNPGEKGNAAIFGHSSNNIFNKGKYKFAFVLLSKLEANDVFYITYNGKVYAYKVFNKKIVKPTEVGVLGPVPGKESTATLITCDPPGTTINRLIVIGEQISPDPNGNVAATQPTTTTSTSEEDLPGNGPTLWTRMWRSVFGN